MSQTDINKMIEAMRSMDIPEEEIVLFVQAATEDATEDD